MSEASHIRTHLHDAVQHTVSLDEDLPEGAMLMGWLTIAEWMAPDGNRWLSKIDGNTNSESMPPWQAQGYLHNALFDAPSFDEDDE